MISSLVFRSSCALLVGSKVAHSLIASSRVAPNIFQSTAQRSFSSTISSLFASSLAKETLVSKMPPPIIDVDCNLLHTDLLSIVKGKTNGKDKDEKKNKDDDGHYDAILQLLSHESTKQSNIIGMLSPSSTIKESKRSIDLLNNNNNNESSNTIAGIQIKTTVGVHPYHATEESISNESTQTLHNLVTNYPQFVACIGECGLDYSEGFPPSEYQKKWFDVQIDLALELALPLFIHERLAFDDTLLAIDSAIRRHREKNNISIITHDDPKIIIHCFTGTSDQCKEYIHRGYYISLSGYFLKNGDGPEQIRNCLLNNDIPLNKLMVETDAPYMGFASCRKEYFNYEEDLLKTLNSKKRKQLKTTIYPNVPCSIRLVVKGMLELINQGRESRNEDLLDEVELCKILCQNSIDFFGFDLSLKEE